MSWVELAPAARPDEARLISVMYHYVRPRDRARWSGLAPLEPGEFIRQIDFLSSIGRIIHPDELDDDAAHDEHRILLTFDDGTRDHFTNVFPILRERGLSGLFAPISCPRLERHAATFHLLHLLLSTVDDQRLWVDVERAFPDAAVSARERAAALYPRDSGPRAATKHVLNFGVPPRVARAFIVHMLAVQGKDLVRFATEWYLSDAEIAEMHAAGMRFATHAHWHTALSGDAGSYVASEIDPCEAWLTGILGRRPTLYIAPFGGASAAEASVDALAPVLQQRGYRHGFLTRAGVEPVHPANFFLRRLDCADLPPRTNARPPVAAPFP